MTVVWVDPPYPPYQGRHRRDSTPHDRHRDMDTHRAKYVGRHRRESQ